MTRSIPSTETPSSTTDSSTDNSSLLAPPKTTASDGNEENDGKRHVYARSNRSRAAVPTSQQLTVAVRIRPINEAEKGRKAFDCAFALDQQKVLLVDPEKFENNILRQNRQHERQFLFDRVFAPGSTHAEVHELTTAPLVDFVVSGYNATVFAYGPTGSGKTYTMVGTEETPGLMTQITRSLYAKINPNEYTVYISFLEIYNEIIRDLLVPQSPPLDLLEDEKGAVQVPGLSRVKAPNTNKIMQILQAGNSRRSQEPTAANAQSSRSHALLQITLYKRQVQHGKLFLIDLAGSERAANSLNHGKRLKEGAAINRSLLALGNVINALSSGNKGRYVNYRDSKLTRLLKDSLGGNSKTIMLAHVTPSSLSYDESYNTLVYASRARNITTRIAFNRPASADQVYSNAITEMHKQIREHNGGGMTHAVSSHQISEQGLNPKPSSNSHHSSSNHSSNQNDWNSSPNVNGQGQGKFASLFNSLKAQYLSTCEKQQKLRERLHKANHEAFDVEMNIISKRAILLAWENRTKDDEEKYSEVIERLKRDSVEEEKLLSTLHETRRKTERALRKNSESLQKIETRLRQQARDSDKNELVNLLVRMGQKDAENMALASDGALQNLRLKKQESSLIKVQKYEQIADKLISSANLEEEEREKLKNEYKLLKNQLRFHLMPLKGQDQVVSWNSMLLNGAIDTNSPEFRLPEIQRVARQSTATLKKQSSFTALPHISSPKVGSGNSSG